MSQENQEKVEKKITVSADSGVKALLFTMVMLFKELRKSNAIDGERLSGEIQDLTNTLNKLDPDVARILEMFSEAAKNGDKMSAISARPKDAPENAGD